MVVQGETATIVVAVPPCPVSGATEVRVEFDAGVAGAGALPEGSITDQIVGGYAGTMRRLHDLLAVVNGAWPNVAPPDLLLNLVQMGNRLSIDPAAAPAEFSRFLQKSVELKAVLDKLPLSPEARVRANALLKEMGY